MKKHFVIGFCSALVALAVLGATIPPFTTSNDYLISNLNDNNVGLFIQKSGTHVANAVEYWRGGNCEFRLAGTNTVATLKTDLGIQSGVVTNQNGTTTNVAFSVAYSVPPAVIVGEDRVVPTNAWVSTVTTSNFTVSISSTAIVGIAWHAIGTP